MNKYGILIHGMGGAASQFDEIASALPRWGIKPKFPEFWSSEKPFHPDFAKYTIDSYVGRLLMTLSAIPTWPAGDVTVIGHSLGGIIALRAAVTYPEWIKRVMLIAPPMMGTLSDQTLDVLGTAYYQQMLGENQPFILLPEDVQALFFSGDDDPSISQIAKRATPPKVVTEIASGAVPSKKIPRIPIRVISTEVDAINSSEGHAKWSLKNKAVHRVVGGTHCGVLNEPELIHQIGVFCNN